MLKPDFPKKMDLGKKASNWAQNVVSDIVENHRILLKLHMISEGDNILQLAVLKELRKKVEAQFRALWA